MDQMKNKKILILDDETDVLDILKKKFERAGLTAFTATNGEDGLEIAQKEDLDIVVSDVVMPRMDGFLFYKELKKNPKTANIPVLIITALPSIDSCFHSMGITAFMNKPFAPQEAVKRVNMILNGPSNSDTKDVKEKIDTKMLIKGVHSDQTSKCIENLRIVGINLETKTISDGEILLKTAVTYVPDFILVDILSDDIPAEKLITALKSDTRLNNCVIITYTSCEKENLENPTHKERFDLNIKSCNAANIPHIGKLSKTSLLLSILELKK